MPVSRPQPRNNLCIQGSAASCSGARQVMPRCRALTSLVSGRGQRGQRVRAHRGIYGIVLIVVPA